MKMFKKLRSAFAATAFSLLPVIAQAGDLPEEPGALLVFLVEQNAPLEFAQQLLPGAQFDAAVLSIADSYALAQQYEAALETSASTIIPAVRSAAETLDAPSAAEVIAGLSQEVYFEGDFPKYKITNSAGFNMVVTPAFANSADPAYIPVQSIEIEAGTSYILGFPASTAPAQSARTTASSERAVTLEVLRR